MPRRFNDRPDSLSWGTIVAGAVLAIGLHTLRKPPNCDQRRRQGEARRAERARADRAMADFHRKKCALRQEEQARYTLLERIRAMLWDDASFNRAWLDFAYDRVGPQSCSDQIVETERYVTSSDVTVARLEDLGTGEALAWRSRGGPEAWSGMTLHRGDLTTVGTSIEHRRRHPGDEHQTIEVSPSWTTDDLICASRFLNCTHVCGPVQPRFGSVVLIKPKERYRDARNVLDDDLISFGLERLPNGKLA